MKKQEKFDKVIFGLVGKNISYSFSKGYFLNKFIKHKLDNHLYLNFDIENIEDLLGVINKYKTSIKGLNITIPYKQSIFKYLDKIDKTAKKIGAVNTVGFTDNGELKGYNSDVFGFKNSLVPLLQKHHTNALILGTGGASNAVSFVLEELGLKYYKVSRAPKQKEQISYSEINKELIRETTIIINCSPVGTFPNIEDKPLLPYQFITNNHLLYDLIYNPEETSFLAEGKKHGAQIKNGLEMLELQAEESWRIWNK
tara:strand:- start:5837 stop:6601 length:765 start_codon:yes stop_codon:yes gene_type:complete